MKTFSLENMLSTFKNGADQIELFVIGIVFSVVPWLAPIPSALLIARATMVYLKWNLPTGIITAIIIEGIGITSIKLALDLRHYNVTRRKTDEAAPFIIAAGLVGIYLITAVSLTVFLELFPSISQFAPVIFPLFTILGGVNIALWTEHKHRLHLIDLDRQDRKVKRQESRSEAVKPNVQDDQEKVSNIEDMNVNLDKLQAARLAKLESRVDRLLDAYRSKPDLSPTEAAHLLGVSRTTVYSYIDKLEEAGQIRRNGNGMHVNGQ